MFSIFSNHFYPSNKFIIVIFLQAISGCGHLLFEIVRGVSNKFHSCIESFLPLLLEHLKEKKEHQDILFKVLTQTFEDSLQNIVPKEFNIVWTHIHKCLEEIIKDDEQNIGLEYILRLTGQIIEHQQGKYLLNPQQFALLLVKIICRQTSENILEVCSQIGALMLLSSNISLPQEHAGIIVKVLLPLPHSSILINFVQNVIQYSQFDMHILPPFIKFVIQSNFDSDAMATLAKICLTKSPLSKNGLKLFEWVKYPMDFGKGQALLLEHVKNVLTENIEKIIESPTNLMNVLYCLPHIENINVEICIKMLSNLISKFLEVLVSYNLEAQTEENKFHCDTTPVSKLARKVMFLLANTMECAIHISSCKRLKDICDIDTLLPIILPCAADPNYLVALHIIDLYLTAYEHENGLTYPFLSLVDSYLRPNVTSPFHIVSINHT